MDPYYLVHGRGNKVCNYRMSYEEIYELHFIDWRAIV